MKKRKNTKNKSLSVKNFHFLIIFSNIFILIILSGCQKQEKFDIAKIKPYTDEYNQVLNSSELIEEYKQTHKYLDDVGYYALYVAGFDYVGYSKIWDTMVLTFPDDETRYYANLPQDIQDAFNCSEFSLDYFNEWIAPYYEYTIPEDTYRDIQNQYVKIRNLS